MRFFLILTLFCLVKCSISQKCPARYLRFTPQHTFCLQPNPSCQIKRTGVSQEDKDLILELHNHFRSRIAMGEEHKIKNGIQPQAADMMKMEWDDELASIAQKWTENCEWGHDCEDCREVENFFVGQNLAMKNYSQCNNYVCEEPSDEPEWIKIIPELYDEVMNYTADRINRFKSHPEPETDHLTQIIWSRSWRIGCGYSFYKQRDTYHKYYVCNYGPNGNINEEFVYKQGLPCTACPTNTECSTIRSREERFPGLCKMTNPNTAPVYPRKQSDSGFYCGVWIDDMDCELRKHGPGTLKTVHTLQGSYKSIALNGGQTAYIEFWDHIQLRDNVPNNNYCLCLNLRTRPLDGSRTVKSILKVMLAAPFESKVIEIKPQSTSFTECSYNISPTSETQIRFRFDVPKGAGKTALDISKIEVYKGSCTEKSC